MAKQDSRKFTTAEYWKRCSIKRDDISEYTMLTEYTGIHSRIKIRHNCGNEYFIKAQNFMVGQRCAKCQKEEQKIKIRELGLRQRYSNEEYKKMFEEQSKNEYELLSEYINSKTKITIKCKNCGKIYSILPTTFQHGYRCQKCSSDNRSTRITLDKFKDKMSKFRTDSLEYEILEFGGLLNPLKLKHIKNDCNREFYISRAKCFLYNKRTCCPKCRKYINGGHKEYISYLNSTGILFFQEYSIEGCVIKRNLLFDVIIYKDNKLVSVIEFDGPQHRSPIYGNEKFEKQKISDKTKDEFCKIKYHYYEFQ